MRNQRAIADTTGIRALEEKLPAAINIHAQVTSGGEFGKQLLELTCRPRRCRLSAATRGLSALLTSTTAYPATGAEKLRQQQSQYHCQCADTGARDLPAAIRLSSTETYAGGPWCGRHCGDTRRLPATQPEEYVNCSWPKPRKPSRYEGRQSACRMDRASGNVRQNGRLAAHAVTCGDATAIGASAAVGRSTLWTNRRGLVGPPLPLLAPRVGNTSTLLGSLAGKRVTAWPTGAGDPDPFLLVDREMKRPFGLARAVAIRLVIWGGRHDL